MNEKFYQSALKTLITQVKSQAINLRSWGISYVLNSLKILELKPSESELID